MRLSTCLLFLVFVAPVTAGEMPEKILRYARDSEAERNARIIKMLKASKDHRKENAEFFNTLTDPFQPYFGYMKLTEAGSAGTMGVVDWGRARVVQVLDSKNVLVEIGVKINQRVRTGRAGGKNIYRTRIETIYTGPFWITDVATGDLSDGQSFSADGVFEIVGNETYETAAGSTNTVKKVAPIDLSEHRELFTLKHRAREWTDKSGKHTIKALFIEYKRGIVHLKTPGGGEKEVKLSALSKADQKYVREKVTGKRP